MSDTVASDDDKLVFVKQKAGVEDIMFGIGSVAQVREGENVTINLVSAADIPYDSTRSVKDVLDKLLAGS